MEKSILDRPIYTIVHYIYAFLATNVYFLLANACFIFVFYFATFTIENILLFYLSLLPLGPAMAGLFATMDKLVREKMIQPTKDYWYYYRKNFKIAMKYWLIQATIMLILMVDIHYANLFAPLLAPLFVILLAASACLMLYAFPILTKFEVKLKNLFLVSFYANFRYFKRTLLNASTIVALGFIYYAIPSVVVLFFMSLLCFFFMFNLQSTFKKMQEELSNHPTLVRDQYETFS